MRKIFAIVLLLCLCMSACKSYNDYYEMKEESLSIAEAEEKEDLPVPYEAQMLPDDVVIIDDYSKIGTISLLGGNQETGNPDGTYANCGIRIKKVVLCDDMSSYSLLGDDDGIEDRLKQVYADNYDMSTGKFISHYKGVDMKILMIAVELINDSDRKIWVNLEQLHLFNIDDEKKKAVDLFGYQYKFHDHEEASLRNSEIKLAAGEHRDVVMFRVIPDKRIMSYINNGENETCVVTSTEEMDYESLYLRLDCRGNGQIQRGENFIKIKCDE